jgi:hypothetical protein
MVHNTVTKLFSIGSILDKKKSQQEYVMIDEKSYDINTQSDATC